MDQRKIDNYTYHRHKLLQLFTVIIYFTFVISLSYAQTFKQNLLIEYKNNLLTISAQNADLKNVLLKLAKETNIMVRFPDSLEKKITIKLSKHSLNEALSRILKGLNHAIIYSASKKNRTIVSEVLVYNKSEISKISNRSKPRNQNIARRIRLYENRLKTLNERFDDGSASRKEKKRYLKQIRVYKDVIEKLKRKL